MNEPGIAGARGDSTPALLVGLLVGLAVTVLVIAMAWGLSTDEETAGGGGGGGTDTSGSDMPAGPPFSALVQQDIARLAAIRGVNVQVGPDTGQCEVMYQVATKVLVADGVNPVGTITQANAVAMTSPGGSLFLTIANATNSHPEALSALQACIPYYVGRPL